MREAGVFNTDVGQLRQLEETSLPTYIPMIRHKSRRALRVSAPVVALSISDVLKMNSLGQYGPVAHSGTELRAKFGLSPNAKILLVSVATDDHLERYWRFGRKHDAADTISKLDLIGMTTPNFSFFEDAPRLHTLRNRSRIIRVAEDLSAAGVSTVLHLNALIEEDWQFWTDLLKDRQDIRYVVKEFQTGLKQRVRGEAALKSLRQLQDDIGRPLHPIIVGGTKYVRDLRQLFGDSFTLIDSTPFIKTLNRQKRIWRAKRFIWEKNETAIGAPIDGLLEENIERHVEYINRTVTHSRVGLRGRRPSRPFQGQLDFSNDPR